MPTRRKRQTLKNSKNSKNSKNIIFEKYNKNVLGVNVNSYILKFNNPISCRKSLTIKLRPIIRKFINEKLNFSSFFSNKDKVFSLKLNRYDNHFTEKIIKYIDNYKNEKYTFCLNKNSFIFQETKTHENSSIIKDLMSKHMILCDKNPCAAGEMVIHNNTFIVDNNSATYKPSIYELQSLKKSMPFINLKITNRASKNNEKHFDNL
jgi:hypothetical protein